MCVRGLNHLQLGGSIILGSLHFNDILVPKVSLLHVIFDLGEGSIDYLLGITLSYLESLHYSRLNVFTYVENNPLGTIKHVIEIDINYMMLFEKCNNKCNVNLYRNTPTKVRGR
jgi:hypothetical protein